MRLQPFLKNQIICNDIVIATIISIGQLDMTALVERIYSTKFGIKEKQLGSRVQFYPSTDWYTKLQLTVGDRAIVFLSLINDNLYQYPTYGEFLLEEREGSLYGITTAKHVHLRKDVPQYIREASSDDAKGRGTAIRFHELERYLLEMIKRRDTDSHFGMIETIDKDPELAKPLKFASDTGILIHLVLEWIGQDLSAEVVYERHPEFNLKDISKAISYVKGLTFSERWSGMFTLLNHVSAEPELSYIYARQQEMVP